MKQLSSNRKKIGIIVASVIFLVLGTIGATLSMLNQKTQAASNVFEGAAVNIAVFEDGRRYEEQKTVNDTYLRIAQGTAAEKTVAVENLWKEDYPTTDTFVRVRLVPAFVYDEESAYAGQIVPIDMRKVVYTYGEDDRWKYEEIGGEKYYYYTQALKPGTRTENLITAVDYQGEIPKDAHFELKVLAEGIASKQKDSLRAWNLENFDSLYELPIN